MLEIIKILVAFGMDFEYEHHGSQGEKIVSFELGLEVSNQNGKIYYQISCEPEDIEENASNYKYLARKIEEECINETSSF